jgi:hypothetical protein
MVLKNWSGKTGKTSKYEPLVGTVEIGVGWVQSPAEVTRGSSLISEVIESQRAIHLHLTLVREIETWTAQQDMSKEPASVHDEGTLLSVLLVLAEARASAKNSW